MEDTNRKELLEKRRKRIFSLRSLLIFILCASLVVFLVTIFDAEAFGSIIRETNPVFLIGASLCYLFSNFFKTLRFLVFFDREKLSLARMFTVVSYHNFFNQIMPARTGELTLVYYLKTILKMDVSRGVHSLLVVRFMDLFIVAVFFIVSFLFTATKTVSPALLAAACGIGIVSLAVILFIDRFMKPSARIFDAVTRATGLSKVSVIHKGGEKLYQLAETFGKDSVTHKIPMLVMTSLLVWGALYTFSYFVIMAFTDELSYFQSVLGSTAAVLTNVLPINSFGSFGTMEAGWVGGYYLVGIGKNVAILSAFTYHLVNFASAGIIALACMAVYRVRVKN
ncbi:MAG: lysylphosphatidylglycerol synthase transmembrane domain-containing protein [Spirochaetota bacterium]